MTKFDGQKPRVGVILVNYAVDPVVLQTTVEALAASTGDVLREVLVIDNASPTMRQQARNAIELIRQTSFGDTLEIRWIDNPTNRGFVGGVERWSRFRTS